MQKEIGKIKSFPFRRPFFDLERFSIRKKHRSLPRVFSLRAFYFRLRGNENKNTINIDCSND
ncbi:hypothetical protein CH376_07055 [Leptospira adleri]|uniref:Uncharacterized protein n=1 Tax=Leptospira adleri TaxID=2023186 RepID=A0ABX4P1D6_9LEPT|nr:hypothetical protein CH376_07055 [Leptospira adleri]